MKSRVLLVDDDVNVLSAYRRNLRLFFEIETASSGQEGLELLKSSLPFAVVVSDYYMPEMNGIEFLTQVKQIAPDTVRVMLSGQADLQATIEAINEGSIFRFLYKPCSSEQLINTIKASVEQYQLIISEKELLNKTLKGSIQVLVDILSLVNPQLFSRIARLPSLTRKIASRLNYDNIWEIELAALLCQIGSVTVPKNILDKLLSRQDLQEEEAKIWLNHPRYGKKILAKVPRLENIAEGILYQFKNYDGSGFPEDEPRKSVAIPRIGRLLKIVIDYDILIEKGIQDKQALEIMHQRSGYYDPVILAALEAEILSIEHGYVVRTYPLNDVNPGMILADEVKDNLGVVLIPRGYEVTEVMKLRLQSFAAFNHFNGYVKVKVPIQ